MSTHRFIVANLCARQSRPTLVAVDAALYDAISHLPWRTDALGRVYRQYNTPEGRRLREHLASRVFPPFDVRAREIVFANSDPLDCRAENLSVGQQSPKRLRPGDAITSLEGYEQALANINGTPKPHGRPGRLNQQQVRQLLDECTNGFMKGESASTIQLWIEEAFASNGQQGPTIHVSQLHKILKGECQHIAGYDYQKLQLTRSTRQSFQ